MRSLPFLMPPCECRCFSVMEINRPAAPTGRFTAPSLISGKDCLTAASSLRGFDSVMLSTPTASIQWTLPVLSSTPT